MDWFTKLPFALVCGVLLASLVPESADGCEFCLVPTLTFTEQVKQSKAAVIAEWKSATPPVGDETGQTEFVVQQILVDADGLLLENESLTVNEFISGTKGAPFLLINDNAKETLAWTHPQKLSPEAREYIARAPSSNVSTTTRLRYFLRFLEHPDQDIAIDAYGEFARASYDDIKAISGEFNPVQLRKWLSDSSADTTRRGLYGLMLGCSGGPEDARFLEAIIVQPTQEFRLGIDGMMAGYLMLNRAQGMTVLDKAILDNQEIVSSEVAALAKAMRFLWDFEPQCVPRPQLQQAMRKLLVRPEFVELTIADLRRWQDWESTALMPQLLADPKHNFPSTRRTIVRFLLAAASEENTSISVQQRTQAQRILDDLSKQNPGLIEDAKRLQYD
ncbi:MAG: hypothetical protein KDA66_02520 [Planctomycetaceae bacterium]|nr:hypothetical protein [Planctomycetaceae bacterium]